MRVGIVGCGFVSQLHRKAWEQAGATIVSVCDIYETSAIKLAAKLNAKPYTDFNKMLELENLDAVSVCTPPFNHAEIASEAIKRGCMIVVEKPFTSTSKEAEKFRKTKKITIIHNQIFEPYIKQAVDSVKNGIIGEVFEVNVTNITNRRDSMTTNPNHWSHKMVGGRIAECLPHPVYIAQAFLGEELEVEHIYKNKTSSLPVLYDELRVVLSGRNARGAINVNLNGSRSVSMVDVYGSNGVLKAGITPRCYMPIRYGIDTTFPSYVRKKDRWKLVKAIFHQSKSEALKDQSSHYQIIKSLIDGEPLITAESAFNTMRIIDRILGWK